MVVPPRSIQAIASRLAARIPAVAIVHAIAGIELFDTNAAAPETDNRSALVPSDRVFTVDRDQGVGIDMTPIALDHLVLYVEDEDATCAFYESLGASCETFGDGRRAIRINDQKINLHPAGDEYDPHARRPTPGSGDFCLIIDTSVEAAKRSLEDEGIEIVHGPVEKTGARGPMDSIYVTDPDGNLVELASYRT